MVINEISNSHPAVKPGISFSQKYTNRKVSCPQVHSKVSFCIYLKISKVSSQGLGDLPTPSFYPAPEKSRSCLPRLPIDPQRHLSSAFSMVYHKRWDFSLENCLLFEIRFNSRKHFKPPEVQKSEMDPNVTGPNSLLLVRYKHPRLTLSS